MDVETNEVVLRGLSMPHSPRWYQGQLWLLESGQGSLALVDLQQRTWRHGRHRCRASRAGSTFTGRWPSSGSRRCARAPSFSGIPLVERLKERTCGVWVVHIETGQTVGFLRFEAGVQEIFAVQVLPGIRFPEMLEWGR